MPDINLTLKEQAGGNRQPVKGGGAGGAATLTIGQKQLSAGDTINASVISKLGSERYALDVQGERLIVRSSSQLPVNGSVTFQVQEESGGMPSLVLTGATSATGKALTVSNGMVIQEAAQALPASFVPESLNLSFPAESSSGKTVVAPVAGGTLLLSLAADGSINATVLGDATSILGAESKSSAVGSQSAQIASAAKLQMDAKAATAANINVRESGQALPNASNQEAARLLQSLPSGTKLQYAISEVKLAQTVEIFAQVVVAEGKNIQAKVAGIAQDPLSQKVLSLLPKGQDIPALVADFRQGSVVFATAKGEVALATNATQGLTAGMQVQLKAGELQMQLGGRIESPAQAPATIAQVKIEGRVDAILRDAAVPITAQTRQVASALLAENVPVTLPNVQALSALASEVQDSGDSLLRAGAHQLAQDIPLDPRIARGMEQMLSPSQALSESVGKAAALLAAQEGQAGLPANVAAAMQEASQSLASLPIALGSEESPAALQSFAKSFATPLLQGVLSSIESAAKALLASSSTLQGLNALQSELAQRLEGLSAGLGSASATAIAGGVEHASMDDFRAACDSLMLKGGDAAQAERALAILRKLPDSALQQAQAYVVAQENAELARQPAFDRLASAHEVVRDMSERMLAYKAENLAASRQDSSVFMAELPLRFGQDQGSGHLRCYLRNGNSAMRSPKPWSSRVVLDLKTTNMGQVIGDMRFSTSRLDIAMASGSESSLSTLMEDGGELENSLKALGFNPKITFHEIKPPVADVQPRNDEVPPASGQGGSLNVQA